MKFSLPVKDWIGIVTTIVLITLSWASQWSATDKNNAILNQKVDALLMGQASVNQTIGTLGSSIVDLKIAQGKSETRLDQIEKIYAPLIAAK